jgi:hypothetical protein
MSESSSFLDQRNEAFREVHPGPTKNDFSVKVDESVYREAMTLKDVQEKNRQTVDDLFKQEEIGSVFEKGQKLEEKALSNEKDSVKPTTNNGIDSRGLESIRQESSAQDKTIQQSSVGSNFGL